MTNWITTIPDKIFLWDLQGNYVGYYYTNAQLKHYVGPSKFLQQNILDVLPWEMGEKVIAAFQTAIKAHHVQVCHIQLPLDGVPHRQVIRLIPYGERVLGLVNDYPLETQTELES